MQEFNLVGLLQKYSGEVVVVAVVACLISSLIKKSTKISDKTFLIISFLFGVALYIPVGIVLKEVAVMIVANAITSGALSTTLSLVMKKYTNYTSDDIKKSLEKLLSSIVLSEQLDEVVDGILQKLMKQTDATKEDLKEIIKQNVSEDLSDSELENIVSFIVSACGLNQKKTDE